MDTTTDLTLELIIRDLGPQDLGDLEWSGGPEHLAALDVALQASYLDEVALIVIALPTGTLIAVGGVDFRKLEGAAELWMLSVRESWQSLGVGTILIEALHDIIRSRGGHRARLRVEHDNPRAAALYRRLGYREVGTTLDGWPVGGGRSYVTVSQVCERPL